MIDEDGHIDWVEARLQVFGALALGAFCGGIFYLVISLASVL